MSRPSDPVGTVSISTAFWFLPRRMIEPLPNARSICDRAASSALVLSTLVPSTSRRFGWVITFVLLSRAASDPQSRFTRPPRKVICARFVLPRKFFFCSHWGYSDRRPEPHCGHHIRERENVLSRGGFPRFLVT